MDSALARKLRLDSFANILIQHMPEGMQTFIGLPYDTAPSGAYGLVIHFVFDLEDMKRAIYCTAQDALLAEGGYLYLAYPKKGNRAYGTHIDRDSIFPFLGVDDSDGFVSGTTLKFARMVALDAVFTIVGLKHLPHGERKKNAPSARVGDYAAFVPVLREAIAHRAGVAAAYDSLTPGYQKDWARYVYSAKAGATRADRLEKMADILASGYKSIDLYRQDKK